MIRLRGAVRRDKEVNTLLLLLRLSSRCQRQRNESERRETEARELLEKIGILFNEPDLTLCLISLISRSERTVE